MSELLSRDEVRRKAREISEYMSAQLLEFNNTLGLQIMNGDRCGLTLVKDDGRNDPVDYKPIIEREVILDDVLDADVVVRMKAAPADPFDVDLAAEEHIHSCAACLALAKRSGRVTICSHCLEEKLCDLVPYQTTATPCDDRVTTQMPSFQWLTLCRLCRRDADRGGLMAQ